MIEPFRGKRNLALAVALVLAVFQVFLALLDVNGRYIGSSRAGEWWSMRVTASERGTLPDTLGQRTSRSHRPQLAIEPYVRPELARRMEALRPVILAAAARHNRPTLSGMSDRQFAEVIALLMYNEHNGWLEDEIEPLRLLTPVYERMQVQINSSGVGSDFSVWPTNLRPSVALEILHGEVPLPEPTVVLTVPLQVAGSNIVPEDFSSQQALLSAISREICQDELGVEYLAANLERGFYRADYEGVPVSWRTLAAWHNQGIVQPAQIRENEWASEYIRRTSAYLPTARRLLAQYERPGSNDRAWPMPEPR
jgi:hypothetical protein